MIEQLFLFYIYQNEKLMNTTTLKSRIKLNLRSTEKPLVVMLLLCTLISMAAFYVMKN